MKKMMKTLMLAAGFVLIAGRAEAAPVSIEDAIGDFSAYLKDRIQQSALTAVLTVEAPVRGIADYVIDTLEDKLLNDTKVRLVSRQSLELIKKEQNIQADGSVNDETAAAIGRIAGWKTVILGAVTSLETGYRMSLRAVAVESGELLGVKTYQIKNDAMLTGIVNPNPSVQVLSQREEILKPFTAVKNDFDLRIAPAGGKDVFYDGEEMYISLRAGEDCYFVVYQVDVNNQMQIIYPNSYDTDNKLKGGVERIVPEYSLFDLHAPFGEERILVYASKQPIAISPEQYEPKPLSREYMSNPGAVWQRGGAEGSKGMSVRPRGAAGQFSYSLLPR
jgi:hypothetical protein